MAKEAGKKKNVRVHLKGVRASYLHVFKKHAFEDNEPKYSGTFIIDPRSKEGKAAIADMNDAIDDVIDTTFNGKNPKNIYCEPLDGNDDENGREEYADMMLVKASNNNRPKILDRDKEPLHEDDGRPYSGCYVNAIVDVWGSPKYKSVQATLMGVQFVRDGDPMSGGHVSDDEFDEVEDDEDSGRGSSRKRGRDRDDDDGGSRRSRRGRDDDDGGGDDDRRGGRSRSRGRDDDGEEEAPRRSRSRDDDEDDKPKRGRDRETRRSRDDDEDDKPRGRSRSRDDDDEDEKPRGRSRSRDFDD